MGKGPLADRLENQLKYYGDELAGSLQEDLRSAILELRSHYKWTLVEDDNHPNSGILRPGVVPGYGDVTGPSDIIVFNDKPLAARVVRLLNYDDETTLVSYTKENKHVFFI